jgi:hypothetical protein
LALEFTGQAAYEKYDSYQQLITLVTLCLYFYACAQSEKTASHSIPKNTSEATSKFYWGNRTGDGALEVESPGRGKEEGTYLLVKTLGLRQMTL